MNFLFDFSLLFHLTLLSRKTSAGALQLISGLKVANDKFLLPLFTDFILTDQLE